jgi:hypothetical protein
MLSSRNNLCLTPNLLKEMEFLYSQLRDRSTPRERAVLYTSIVINYEAVLGKVCYPPRPFNYMFFTPLYGVRNTVCPQISTKKKSSD